MPILLSVFRHCFPCPRLAEHMQTLSERFHKKAHMALLRARRRPDSKDASIVAYTRLSHLDSKGADAVGACR